MPNASYAVLTRVRAQYGARLREADYLEMASSKSVPEAAAFLRERTAYGTHFARQEGVPTRGWLESQLRRALRERSLTLCALAAKSSENDFLEYVLLKNSVNDLLGFLRCMSAGHPEKHWFSDGSTGGNPYFSLRGLSKVADREGLIECLRGTFFEKIMFPILQNGSERDIPLMEAVLDRSVYEYMIKRFRTFPQQTADALSEILLLKAELEDVELLYRAKKYYGLSPSLLRAMLSGFRLRLRETELEQMLEAEDAETVMRIFRDSRYQKPLAGKRLLTVESWSDVLLPDLLKKRIHFSVEPPVVLFAYLNWMELEIRNLIYVIEGVRYRLPPEEIRSLLSLPEQERM